MDLFHCNERTLQMKLIVSITFPIYRRGQSIHPARRDLSRILEQKNSDIDSDNAVERVPEDLAGKVCYELEPLVTP